ncbi:MAG: SGNH/GDSL hydrolase family protein [Candidatus Omnitrophica bacterium]|jgi:lysophospholipase L1-like esterase|nr:SGNH/GDSL hydrolase family protein [Candidatus Omnitrophota bacterium]
MSITKKLKNIIILILINILFIFAVELAVRLAFPQINFQGLDTNLFRENSFGQSHGFKPYAKGYCMGKIIYTNEFGFRNNPYLEQIDKNSSAIVILGDSISLGSGVSAANVYPFILQKKLKNYKIINSSVTGYDIQDYLNILETITPKIDFEGIIVGICLNDFITTSKSQINIALEDKREIQQSRSTFRILRGFSYKNNNLLEFFRRHSKVYHLLKRIFIDTSKNYFFGETEFYSSPQAKQIISQGLEDIHNFAYRHNKWIVFIVFPYEYQLRPNISYEEIILKPQEIIREVAIEKGFKIIDLYPVLRNNIEKSKIKSESLYLYGDPMHFNSQGHKLIAQLVYDKLKELKLLKDNVK